MAVTLIVQGGSFELHESERFNKVRDRLNQARRMLIDYENGNIDDKAFLPYHKLSFKVSLLDDDSGEEVGIGRISVDPSKVIAAHSDTEKDQQGGFGRNGSDDDDDEGDDEE